MTESRKPPPRPRTKAGQADPGQSRRFVEAARELGADQSEEAFAETLRKIAKAPPQPREPKKPR
jgi:hypothetical protein